jgi:alpha-amylase/alpha-mannosidase (GH57 family)
MLRQGLPVSLQCRFRGHIADIASARAHRTHLDLCTLGQLQPLSGLGRQHDAVLVAHSFNAPRHGLILLHSTLRDPARQVTLVSVMVKRPSPKSAKPQPSSAHRYVCVHGHFYQPPRENPWLETVEVQDSAAPYHDWNDRIAAECYAPNGASRIQNKQNEIVRIVNNYSRMSFNFGPTLLKWLQDKAPRTYRMILDADKTSAQRYSGHGSALAQVYNHMIMPLANRRDAITQIRWGIADFEHRFGRKPEGMWLAETAVSRVVLDLMAAEGIKFTILAPHQCARFRPLAAQDKPGAPGLSSETWVQTPNATVDPTRPYTVKLDEGRSIAIFFYDGPSSRAIAFEGLLNSGEAFGSRLLDGFHAPSPNATLRPELSHVATDGESYGHHHRYGEMALSYAMHWIEHNDHANLTNYGEFLEKFPPDYEAEVVEDTSWSCMHGIERWRSNCGCNGGKPGWNQLWRGPLRDALDFLRDASAPLAEKLAEGLLTDLWAARDGYIDIVLDRSTPSKDRFFARHATRVLTSEERVLVLELLELERHAQLMYTSCGWFFDEISGIETIQVIAYAGRVLQLAAKLFGEPGHALEQRFLEILALAKSNLPDLGDGAELYRRYVTGIRIGLEQVGAHYAISSIFRSYPEDGELFCFELHRDSHESFTSGRGKVALGRAHIRSQITEEAEEICFAVLHLGDQNLSAAVRRYASDDPADVAAFAKFTEDVGIAIRHANLPEVIRLIDRFFGTLAYSLTSLFADEQQRILRTILDRTLAEMEDSLRKIYEDHASLLRFLTESGMAAPPALAIAANFAINASLRSAIAADNFDSAEIETLLARATADQVAIDTQVLSFAAADRMKRAMVQLEAAAEKERAMKPAVQTALTIAVALRTLPFDVNLWQAQNIWNDLYRRSDKNYWPPEWTLAFQKLGEALYIAVDEIVIDEGVSAF